MRRRPTGAHEVGISYLETAKEMVALARRLEPADAEFVRRTADKLTERGLDMIMKGAKELAEMVRGKTAPTPQNAAGES